MSWSWSGTGKPSKVKAALVKFGEGLTGMSKEEFDAVCAGIESVLDANTDDHGVTLSASGHGYKENDVLKHSTCQVDIKSIGLIVE